MNMVRSRNLQITLIAAFFLLIPALAPAAPSPASNLTATIDIAATPAIALNPVSLTFTSQLINSTSAAQSITVSNGGTAQLTLSMTISGDFAKTTTCGAKLAANATCAISVTFTPTATGARTGSLTITSNSVSSPYVVSLSGTGTAGSTAPTATISANPASITSGSSTLTWSSTNATSCTASGGWTGTEATSGTLTVSPTSSTAYTLTCTGTGGTSSPASATVTVTSGGSGGGSGSGPVPTNVQIIRQGQNLNTATNSGSGCTVVSKGGTSSFEPNYEYIGWHSVSGATSYNIYRATNGGNLSLYDTLTASAAATNYSTYVTGLTNVGNTYYAAPGIDSAYFDTHATAVIGNNGSAGSDFTATANVTSGSTSINITSISSGAVAVGQGIGDTNGNIPMGTTLVSGPGGTGTYTMSQAATGSATGETVGAVISGNQGYTYKVTAVVGGVESAQSAFAYIPFIVNGGFQTSSGAFDSCMVANQTAPATTPLGWSQAAAWWPVEPASGPVTNPPPLPNCNGYPQYMNTYTGWAAPSYNLSVTGYKYLNLSVWTAESGAQLSGGPEICGDAGLTNITAAQMANYGPATLNQNAWSTYKIPLSVAYSNKNGVAQTALYKITWGISGTPSTAKPVYIEYWFSVE